MAANLEHLGFGSEWRDFRIDTYEGYVPNMSDYHMHKYYEISLILSGDVKVLLPDSMQSGKEPRIVLTPPMTAHFMVCEPNMLYRRVNLLFSRDFIADYIPEWRTLLSAFSKSGKVIHPSDDELAELCELCEKIKNDTDIFRRRLMLLLFLSKIGDMDREQSEQDVRILPSYVTSALSYLHEHYSEKIVAAELAKRLDIGRTTLMTAFKEHTGVTMCDYLCEYRLKKACLLLRDGATQQYTAEQCGFGDASNLIRAFRRHYGTTPGKYIREY